MGSFFRAGTAKGASERAGCALHLSGPLCSGEVGSTGPQGNRQGCRFLFVRAGCPVEKPGRTSRTCRAWMPGKRQAGWPSLWLLSLGHARESDSPSEGGRKLFAFHAKELTREHPPLTSVLFPMGERKKSANRVTRTNQNPSASQPTSNQLEGDFKYVSNNSSIRRYSSCQSSAWTKLWRSSGYSEIQKFFLCSSMKR